MKADGAANGSTFWSWIEHLIGPAVVGLVVLAGQFFIQPLINSRQHREDAQWDAKRSCYTEAVKLVNQEFASLKWEGPDAPRQSYQLAPPPKSEAVNQCYAEIALCTENPSILKAFRACFGFSNENKSIKATNRVELLHLMRGDLRRKGLSSEPDDVWFLIKP